MLLLLGLAIQAAAPIVPPTPAPLVSVPVVDRTPIPPEYFSRAQPPKSAVPLASYISDDDYPVNAMRQREQGLVEFALRVGADGRPSGCSILNQSGSVALEHATCRILSSRARFTPARDGAGKAVESALRGRIRWAIPADPVPDTMVLRYRIRADGRASDCVTEVERAGQVERRESLRCERLNTPAEMLAAIRGQSAAAEPHVRMEVRLLKSADAPWPEVKSMDGKVLAKTFARLIVDERGQIGSCTIVDATTILGRAPTPCRNTQRLDPTGLKLPGEIRVVMTVMLEKEPGLSPRERAAED